MLAFVALEVASYTRKSATWDEPLHLMAGYAALTQGDYRIDPSHPPLLRMWASLPLLAMSDVVLDTTDVDRMDATTWLSGSAQYDLSHRFLYRANNAEQLLFAGRFMVVLLGVLLGVLVFCWTLEWLGFRSALFALFFYTISPNIAAHASLVTTDLGVSCFFFGTIYFLWRTCRGVTVPNVAGLTAFFALAVVSKFSAVLLGPIVASLLAVAMLSWRTVKPLEAFAILAGLVCATVLAVWTVYGFHYAPSAAAGWLLQGQGEIFARTRTPFIGTLMGWVDANHLLPNAFTQGFLFSVGSAAVLPGFLAGQISADGWWYYFPVAFLIKTPAPLLALLAVGLAVFRRRSDRLGAMNELFVVLPGIVYLAFAIVSGINIGLRHILPIYPLLLVIAAAGAEAMITARHAASRIALTALVVFWAVRFGAVYPYTLTFFNQFVGGPSNGFNYLSDSNLDWGQGLKELKRWMDTNGVTHINLAYFGQGDPAYYGIDCTYLAGSPPFAVDLIRKPTLPGYVAISATVLSGVYLSPPWRLFYRAFRELEPVADVGNSIRVYWVEEWPEAIDPPGYQPQDASDAEAHGILADWLLVEQQWPRHALVHYGEYLRQRPDDARVLARSGIALAATERMVEATAALRRAVAIDPRNGEARRLLATVLLAAGDVTEAQVQAGEAVTLIPDDPEANDVLGSVLAAQSRFSEAAVHFDRALRLDPTHAAAREHLARLPRQTRPDGLPAR